MTADPIQRAVERARDLQAELNIFTSIEESPRPNPNRGPLSGTPIALKDLIDHQGRVTTAGSSFYRVTATKTAEAVRRLEDAGGTIIGRTGLHEFAFGFSSENAHFGPVRNPWDTDTSPGGSSGGSGAAVAADIVPLAIGTDTGGSVRVPAAMCGAYGLKVTYGRIPLDGVFPLVASIDTVGPIADSTSNIETAYRVMSGDETGSAEPGQLRFGVPQPWYEQAPLSAHVDASFRDALRQIESAGHEVNPIRIPDVLPDQRIIYAIAPEVRDAHVQFREEGREYGPEVAERLENAFSVTEEQAEQGRLWQILIRDRFADALATVDFLLTPTVCSMRKVIGDAMIDGHHYRKVLSWFTATVNHALLPAMAMPLQGTGAPPVSLQAIGPAGSEIALISLARSFDQLGLTGFVPAPLAGRNK